MGAFTWIIIIGLILFIFRKKIQGWLQNAEGPIGRLRRRVNGEDEDIIQQNQNNYNYNHLPQNNQPLNTYNNNNPYPTQYAYPNYAQNYNQNPPIPPNNYQNINYQNPIRSPDNFRAPSPIPPNPYPDINYQNPVHQPDIYRTPSNHPIHQVYTEQVLPPVPTYNVTTSQTYQPNPYKMQQSNNTQQNPYVVRSEITEKTKKI